MESHCPNAPIFNAVLSGLAGLQRSLGRLGYHHDGFRLLIPPKLGTELENELLRADPAEWMPFTDGIQIHAEGSLKQLVVCDSIWLGWKTGRPRKRKVRQHVTLSPR